MLKICRICLRTDVDLQELSENLSEFYEKFCNCSIDSSARFSCSNCENELTKCYDFKKQCSKSNEILTNWMTEKPEKVPLDQLYKELSETQNTDIESLTIDIKTESPIDNTEFETKSEDFKYENGDDNFDDDDDDKALSEFLNIIKVEKEKRKKEKVKITDGTEKTIRRRQRARKPLTNQQELETVFDIQIFKNEADAIKEFQQRCTSDRYISADYKCTVCYTVYRCRKLLEFHNKWHRPSAGDFNCNVCEMRFKSYMSLRKHKNDVHFGLFKCKMCPLVTYHKMVMMHHFQKHQGVEFKCKHCNGAYRHSSTYLTHLRTRHKTEHICVWCARTFVSAKGLMVHTKKAHASEPKSPTDDTATCNECNITFASHAVYIVHVLNTPKHKELASTIIGCLECGLQFTRRGELRAHRRQFHPGYNYCAMQQAERNVALGRPPHERLSHCQLCNKSGSHNTWLYRHYMSEHPQIPYEQVFNQRRKHLCDQCGRSFFNATALREHKNLHTGEKPFSCDKCPAKFCRKSGLKIHSERHLPPTRECQHCGKKFVSASSLSNHMRSHIGDRRYKCEICGKGFLHNAALREHVRGVHHHIRRARKHALKNTE